MAVADFPAPQSAPGGSIAPVSAGVLAYALYGVAALIAAVSYGLPLIAPLTGVLGIVGVIVCYVKRADARRYLGGFAPDLADPHVLVVTTVVRHRLGGAVHAGTHPDRHSDRDRDLVGRRSGSSTASFAATCCSRTARPFRAYKRPLLGPIQLRHELGVVIGRARHRRAARFEPRFQQRKLGERPPLCRLVDRGRDAACANRRLPCAPRLPPARTPRSSECGTPCARPRVRAGRRRGRAASRRRASRRTRRRVALRRSSLR